MNEATSYDSSVGPRIVFRGNPEKERIFLRMPGAVRSSHGIDMPMNPASVLAFETWADLERVTKTYHEMRGEILDVPRSGKYPEPFTEGGDLPPYQHQVDCFEMMRQSILVDFKTKPFPGSGYGVFSEQGTGKTKLVLDCCKYLYRLLTLNVSPCQTVLIIGRKIALQQWRETLLQVGFHDDSIKLLAGTKDSRAKQLKTARLKAENDSDLRLYRAEDIDTQTRLPRGHEPTIVLMNWEVVPMIEPSLYHWDIAVADEAHRLKNRTTQVSKEMHKVSKRSAFRIAMTGTPMGESPADLWSIYEFIDPRVFDMSYSAFIRRYCKLGGYSGFEPTTFLDESVMELITRMYARAHRSTKAAAFDMPPKTYVVKRLEMRPKQAAAYRAAREVAYAETDAMLPGQDTAVRVPTENALTRMLKLQQITCGFMTVFEDDAGKTVTGVELSCGVESLIDVEVKRRADESDEEYYARLDKLEEERSRKVDPSTLRKKIVKLDDAKTDALIDFLEERHEEDPTTRFAIWVTFRAHLDHVNESLKEKFGEESVCYIDGRVKDTLRDSFRHEFNDRYSKRWIMILQTKAGCESIDLKSADYMLILSSVFSGVDRQQLEDRGHRAGRTRPYFIVDFVFPDTVDMVGLRAARTKKTMAALITTAGFTRGLESDFNDPFAPVPDSREWIRL